MTSQINKVDTDPAEAPDKGVGCGALVRAHRWITGIGWTDLGCALALTICGTYLRDSGRPIAGMFAAIVGLTVYIKARRPNTNVQPREP